MIKKIFYTIVVIVASIFIGIGSMAIFDEWVNTYEDVSGTVYSHVMNIRSEKYKSYTVPYLIVDTDKFGRQEFYVNNVTYSSYKDGDRIIIKDVNVDKFTNKNKHGLDKFWYVIKNTFIGILVILYIIILFMIIMSLGVLIWDWGKEEKK